MKAAINEIAGHRNAQDGRLVDICIHLLTYDDWKGEGLHRPEQYLTYRCGIGSPMAHRMVNIARRADALPASHRRAPPWGTLRRSTAADRA